MSGWSIVVPMYRESARIPGTVAALAVSELATPDNEFLFVDDGSPDDTVAAATAALAATSLDARVLRLPRNLGKGAAVRTGVLAARRPVVVFVDADLSSPPAAIVQVCRAVEAGAQVAVASRAHAQTHLVVRQPASREGAGKTFNRLLRRLGLTTMPDTQCGLKAFDAASAQALFRPLQVLRFAFDVEVLLRAARLGLRVEVLPTEWAHVEASRVSPVRDGGRMAWDALRLAISARRGSVEPAPAVTAAVSSSATSATSAERRWLRASVAQLPHRARAVDVEGSCGDALADAGFTHVVVTSRGAPVVDGPADAVGALGVLGSCADDVGALRSWGALLSPDGRLLLTVPARALGRRRPGRCYRRADLEQTAAAAGLDVLEVRPLGTGLAGRLPGRLAGPVSSVLTLSARRPLA